MLINNSTYLRETVSERSIRQPLSIHRCCQLHAQSHTHPPLRGPTFEVKWGSECEKLCHVYQREDNFSITSKMRTNSMSKHLQNIVRVKLLLSCTPCRQSVDHCNKPQSEDTSFNLSLSKCPHFDGVILTLVLALNADSNTHQLLMNT